MSDPIADPRRLAYLWACRLDVLARKPGNVSMASPGHRMQAALFTASAQASVGPLFTPVHSVGQRIEQAMRATLAVVHCNTNLGIVLLCAPMAMAVEHWLPVHGIEALRVRLEGVLHRLDVADAAAAYRAIALAQPGGLGNAAEQDVAQAPTIGLRDAMTLAAERDRIAWQYAHAHADVFERGLMAFDSAFGHAKHRQREPVIAAVQAMQACFLEYLATCADSHIVRKHGRDLAHSVMNEARPWCERARSGEPLDLDPAFAAWDESLKQRSINPGTSADLSVATALLAAWRRPDIVDLPT